MTDRRTLLACMAWTGCAVSWRIVGGVPRAHLLGTAHAATTDLTFVQISDSHIGFAKAPNPNPTATLQEAIGAISQLNANAAFLVHTGDVSQTSAPAQFDTAQQIIAQANLPTHYIPGEHDMANNGAAFQARFSPQTAQQWYAFDQQGVHFIALNNVRGAAPGKLGQLGPDQLAWLANDLRARPSSQPIVIFAHIPL